MATSQPASDEQISRHCSICGGRLYVNNLDGICQRTPRCKRGKQRYRRDMIRAIKVDSGCVDCGYREHPAALEFDHRPGTDKKFTISQAMWKPWAEVLAEIAKCDVRCANCHAIKTSQRRDGMTK